MKKAHWVCLFVSVVCFVVAFVGAVMQKAIPAEGHEIINSLLESMKAGFFFGCYFMILSVASYLGTKRTSWLSMKVSASRLFTSAALVFAAGLVISFLSTENSRTVQSFALALVVIALILPIIGVYIRSTYPEGTSQWQAAKRRQTIERQLARRKADQKE